MRPISTATASISTTSSSIKIRDDVPEPTFGLSSASVIHDETSGQDLDANDVNADLSALFSAVSNKGNDPDVNNALDPAIGYAQSVGSIVSVTPNVGADEPGTVSYAIDLPGFGGVSSGLMTTDGHPITLFEVNSTLVVGRYDGPDGGTNVGSGDPAAFAIHIDPNTGVVTVVQYESIKHDDRRRSRRGK